MNKERFTEIDLLRFLAAIAVVFFHYTFRGAIWNENEHYCVYSLPALGHIFKYGHYGVDLFFMISGFVILMSAMGKSAGEFVIARMIRLYPAYWFCATITFIAISYWGGSHLHASLSQWFYNLSMVQGYFGITSLDASYWTLMLEIKFYFFILLLIVLNQMPIIKYYLGVWTFLSLLSSYGHVNAVQDLLIMDSAKMDYTPFFIAGAVSYLIYQEGNCAYKTILLIFSFQAAMLNCINQLSWLNAYYRTEYNPSIILLIMVMFFISFTLIALHKTKDFRLKQWIILGNISYPLYLIHQNLGYIIFNAINMCINPWVQFILVVSLMIVFAHLVHRYVEERWALSMKEFRWIN